MYKSFFVKSSGIFLTLLATFVQTRASFAGESTMPSQYKDVVQPGLAAKYSYTEDGAFSKALNIPTYEWMPVNATPKTIVLGIHGLTLHGRRFRVLARTLAVNGSGFVSLDMRGFGRCYFGDKEKFSTADDDKTKVDHEKSYQDIVQLAKLIRETYPGVRLIALGESLGCTFCVRLAGEHPDLVDGIALSAPAVKVNHDMYAGDGQIRQGIKAVLRPDHELNMSSFFTELVSERDNVKNEMTDDPLVRKKLKLGELLSTDEFVDKTARWGKLTGPGLAVLILQGSKDGCVSPKHVVDLMNNMCSADQTLDWRGNFGHLQLETCFMRAPTVEAVANWMHNHSVERQARIQEIEKSIADLGGTVQL
jgi:alpha-beta hydrolase superfamily lysophospholipase